MTVQIRPVEAQAEYRAVEDLQRKVWGMADVEVVDHCLLVTAHKNGGLVLGVFEIEAATGQERMIGFAFSLIGLQPNGRPKHCSHMAAVLPAYQGQNIGYRLKLAQREVVLAQGLDLITWTFDPLESRNAYFNFRKLGVTCRTYWRNLYGEMRDNLNFGLPSDRFQVDWAIASRRVADRLAGTTAPPTPSALQAEGTPLINALTTAAPSQPVEAILAAGHRRLLVPMPPDFQHLKVADMALAQAWRNQTRTLFETAFKSGYSATDFLLDAGQGYYLLELNAAPGF